MMPELHATTLSKTVELQQAMELQQVHWHWLVLCMLL